MQLQNIWCFSLVPSLQKASLATARMVGPCSRWPPHSNEDTEYDVSSEQVHYEEMMYEHMKKIRGEVNKNVSLQSFLFCQSGFLKRA